MRHPTTIITALVLAATVLAPAAGAQTEDVRTTERLFLRHPDTGESCASLRFLSTTPATDDLECGWSRNTSTVVEGYSINEPIVLDATADLTGRLELGTHSTTPGYGQYDLSVTVRGRTAEGGFITIGSDGPMEVQAVSVVSPDVVFEWSMDIPDELDATELSSLTFEFTQADSIQVNHGYVRKDERESYLDLPIIEQVETG